ncbi:MAG: M1 family metallopeptidase [Bacteroidia bacterium]|nr:M1 family metallopeptidase [Bacteroidia bacterium]
MKDCKSTFIFHCTLYLILCANFSYSQYFQQEVKYSINVSLNDVKHELSAFESITYINHSPDELKEIYFHLWPNGYKNTETAFARQFDLQGSRKILDADDKDLGFIDSLNFLVEGETVQWVYDSLHIDICKIILTHPLKSGDSINISTPFHVKLPSGKISRMGHIGQSYHISQWYPKPAVYDKYGWHPIPYLDQGEFYSEFGSFDVSITLSKNYVVGATGDLQTESEIFFLEEKINETKNISVYQKDNSFPKSDFDTKTIHYTQNNVHDFAWFADKRFHVLRGEVELPQSKRIVNSWIMFTGNQPDLWKNALEYVNDATYYYSKWLGEYPYNNVTAVDGTISAGGGMEYPNITVIGTASNANELEVTIAHEVGHNWLYGILGSNERDHAWMDEGINTFYELRYVQTKHDSKSDRQDDALPGMIANTDLFGLKDITDKKLNELEYLLNARRNKDQPTDITSEKFSRLNYAGDVYAKTGLSFQYLRSYLGDSLFDSCMHTYFDQWKFRHPYPEDIKDIFETITQKNLSWFFDDLLKTTKKIDYSISSSSSVHDFTVLLKNKGGVDGPVSLSGIDKNGKTLSTKWIDSIGERKKVSLTCSGCAYIRIDSDQNIPEINRRNNSIRTSGILRKWDKLHLQFAGGIEKPFTTQIFYLPVLGWNNYDKIMPGIALHNIFLPEKKFEYVLMPMYSTRTNSLVGGGNISYNFYPGSKIGKEHRINKITWELSGQSYHLSDFSYTFSDPVINQKETFRYSKLSAALIFYFARQNESGLNSNLSLKVNRTQYTIAIYPPPCITCSYIYNAYDIVEQTKYLPEINFIRENTKAINPYSFALGFTYFDVDFYKLAGVCNYRISYKGRNRGFDSRFFIGWIFPGYTANASLYQDYRLRMGGYNGSNDYVYEHVYLGRTETSGILSRQFAAEEGGFKTPTATGQSNSWLLSINLKTNIPGRIPVKLFADFGVYDESALPEDLKQGLMYDYGLEITVIPDIFSIYFPLGFSDDIKRYYDVNEDRFGKWSQRIRYELRLEKLNPVKLIRNIDF